MKVLEPEHFSGAITQVHKMSHRGETLYVDDIVPQDNQNLSIQSARSQNNSTQNLHQMPVEAEVSKIANII